MTKPSATDPKNPTAKEDVVVSHRLLACTDKYFGVPIVVYAEMMSRPATGATAVVVMVLHDQRRICVVDSTLHRRVAWLEVRGPGIWMEMVDEPSEGHWSYGLEAFALETDTPDELMRTGRGHRVPLGWSFDFYVSDTPQASNTTAVQGPQYGRLEGLLLSDSGETPIEATAVQWSVAGEVGAGKLTVGAVGLHAPLRCRAELSAASMGGSGSSAWQYTLRSSSAGASMVITTSS